MVTLVTQRGAREGYEAVIVPTTAEGRGATVFRWSASRPSRRAVLHLADLSDSLISAEVAIWYTERGIRFYLADLDPRMSLAGTGRRQARPVGDALRQLGLACAHLRAAEGISEIILSASGTDCVTAALWCASESATTATAGALILTDPVFGRSAPSGLDISCPVLVISGTGPARATKARRRIGLGAHVTWLNLAAGGHAFQERWPTAPDPGRQFFRELGRWLGAYMYGRDDRLL